MSRLEKRAEKREARQCQVGGHAVGIPLSAVVGARPSATSDRTGAKCVGATYGLLGEGRT